MPNNLKSVLHIVHGILERDPQSRNSDICLYTNVIDEIARRNGKYYLYSDHTFATVAMLIQDGVLPPFESVRRTRQKVQENHPELRAADRVQAMREEQRQEYIEFAHGIHE